MKQLGKPMKMIEIQLSANITKKANGTCYKLNALYLSTVKLKSLHNYQQFIPDNLNR